MPYEGHELTVEGSGTWRLERRDFSRDRIFGGVVLGVGGALSALAIGSGVVLVDGEWFWGPGAGAALGLVGGVTGIATLVVSGYLLGRRDHLALVPVVDASVDASSARAVVGLSRAW